MFALLTVADIISGKGQIIAGGDGERED